MVISSPCLTLWSATTVTEPLIPAVGWHEWLMWIQGDCDLGTIHVNAEKPSQFGPCKEVFLSCTFQNTFLPLTKKRISPFSKSRIAKRPHPVCFVWETRNSLEEIRGPIALRFKVRRIISARLFIPKKMQCFFKILGVWGLDNEPCTAGRLHE